MDLGLTVLHYQSIWLTVERNQRQRYTNSWNTRANFNSSIFPKSLLTISILSMTFSSSLTFHETSPDYNMRDNLTHQTQKYFSFIFKFPLGKIEWAWMKYKAIKNYFFFHKLKLFFQILSQDSRTFQEISS